MKVLILTKKPFAQKAIENINKIINSASLEAIILEKYHSESQVLNAVKDVDAIIVRSDLITNEILVSAKKLKVIVRAGAGTDNIDLTSTTARNIVVMNTPGQNANAVAELTLGMMVNASRNFYDGNSGIELKGKKLGIHGYGNVGKNVARIAKGFEMDIYVYDTFYAEEIFKKNINISDSKEELYKTCQYISLHIPATSATNRSINYRLLEMMQKDAILINTSRKEIIDEEDLMKWMENYQNVKYITDIMPDNDEELKIKFPKRYFSTRKKIGAQTIEANNNAGIAAAKQIVDFLLNGKTQFQIEFKR
ncbi:MAG: 3-phosphoglycerate dehydrogenase [Bacteroidales bacterium OttesenSCG-928-I14]|jgi:D-3-phosphoglycerate dehydrogenase|nr:3-phosphoglycerate dehydrogenase [Bacteroidales bacterium OttesenSCG-928-I14]